MKLNEVQDYTFVVTIDGSPIGCSLTMTGIENILYEYTGANVGESIFVKYVPFNSKFTSVPNIEGIFFFRDKESCDVDEYKVYCVDYKL